MAGFYADFITLLFAFFVVMYSLSSVNEGKYRVLSDSMVQAFRSISINAEGDQVIVPPVIPIPSPKLAVSPKPVPAVVPDPVVAAERQALSARMRSMAEDIKRVLEPLSRGGQVRVTEGAHGITVEINASVLFQVGEATLDSAASTALAAVAGCWRARIFPSPSRGTPTTPRSIPIVSHPTGSFRRCVPQAWCGCSSIPVSRLRASPQRVMATSVPWVTTIPSRGAREIAA